MTDDEMTREQAIRFAMSVIRHSATDWQDVRDALANSDFAEWLDRDDDAVNVCWSIITEAETRLGVRDALPPNYSD